MKNWQRKKIRDTEYRQKLTHTSDCVGCALDKEFKHINKHKTSFQKWNPMLNCHASGYVAQTRQKAKSAIGRLRMKKSIINGRNRAKRKGAVVRDWFDVLVDDMCKRFGCINHLHIDHDIDRSRKK